LRAVREDVEREWVIRVEAERKRREEAEAWGQEVVRALEKEKKVRPPFLPLHFFSPGKPTGLRLNFPPLTWQARTKLEEERRALASFVSKFDSLALSPVLGVSSFGFPNIWKTTVPLDAIEEGPDGLEEISHVKPGDTSPVKISLKEQPSLLEEDYGWSEIGDVSFEMEQSPLGELGKEKVLFTGKRDAPHGKENVVPPL
jgi:centromeric protein E